MKALFSFMFVVLASLAASALPSKKTVVLRDGDIALSPITTATMKVKVDSARGPAVGMWTTAVVIFPLNGCVDRLGPVTSQLVGDEQGKRTLYVAASNIHTEFSKTIKCAKKPTATVEIPLGMGLAATPELVVLTSLAELDSPSSDMVELGEGDIALSPVTTAAIQIKVNSARGPAVGMWSTALVTFPLNGCVDRLGPVTSELVEDEQGKRTLYVATSRIHTKVSETTRCFRAPTATVEIPLGMGVAATPELVVLQ